MKGIYFMALGVILMVGVLWGGMTSWSVYQTFESDKCIIVHKSIFDEEIYKEDCWRYYAANSRKD